MNIFDEINELHKEITNLKDEISSLKNNELEDSHKLSFSASSGQEIPVPDVGGNEGGNGSQGGAFPEWTLIYDMNSDDPVLNWNLKKGIRGGIGVPAGSPPFTKYRYIKLTVFHSYYSSQRIFDLDGTEFYYHTMLLTNNTGSNIVSYIFEVQPSGNEMVFFSGDFFLTTINKSNSFTYASANSSEYFYVSKIEVIPR